MIKYSTLLILCSFAFTSMDAQFSKDTRLLGGSLNFTDYKNSSSPSSNYSQVSVAPSFAKFYKDNRSFGVSLAYEHIFNKELKDGNSYGAGVFLRQYKELGKSRFFVFLEEDMFARFGRSEFLYTTERVKEKTTWLGAGVTPALAYNLTGALQLELFFPNLVNVSYSQVKQAAQPNVSFPGYKRKTFDITTGLRNLNLGDLSLGFSWLINRKAKA